MKISEIIDYLEREVPLQLAEQWDHSGLQIGDPNHELQGVLLAVDVTEAVLREAVERGTNLVVTHHPLLFHALQRISTATYVERCVAYALKHELVLYALHTNLDNSPVGLNAYWAEQMGLQHPECLQPLSGYYAKLSVYIPVSHADALRSALRSEGIGRQGCYSGCSFSAVGTGRYTPESGALPYSGTIGEWHSEPEECVSLLIRREEQQRALATIRAVHPYEEPAIDLWDVRHHDPLTGGGIIGDLPEPLTLEELIDRMAAFQPITSVAVTPIMSERIRRVAYCGGSGAFMMKEAARKGADLFITGEAKYNDYHDAIDLLPLMTLGHYESEELSKKLLNNLLCKKSGTFAVLYSSQCKNPFRYISR